MVDKMGNKGRLVIYLSLVNCAVLCITKHRELVLTSFAEYCAWYSGPGMYCSLYFWSARHWQITIFCDNRVQSLFYYLITELVFFNEYPLEAKRFAISMSDHKKEKSMVSLTHEKSNLLFAAKQLVRWHCKLADHYY